MLSKRSALPRASVAPATNPAASPGAPVDLIGSLPFKAWALIWSYSKIDVQARIILTRNEYLSSWLSSGKPFGNYRPALPVVSPGGMACLDHPRWHLAPTHWRQSILSRLGSTPIQHVVLGEALLLCIEDVALILRTQRNDLRTLIFRSTADERSSACSGLRVTGHVKQSRSAWPRVGEKPLVLDDANRFSLPHLKILAFQGRHACRWAHLMSQIDFPNLQEFAFCSPLLQIPPTLAEGSVEVKAVIGAPAKCFQSSNRLRLLAVSTLAKDKLNQAMTTGIFQSLTSLSEGSHFRTLILSSRSDLCDLAFVPAAEVEDSALSAEPANGEEYSEDFIVRCQLASKESFEEALDESSVDAQLRSDKVNQMLHCLTRAVEGLVPSSGSLLLERSFPSLLTLSVILEGLCEESSESREGKKLLKRLLELLPASVREACTADPLETFLSNKRYANLLPQVREAQTALMKRFVATRGTLYLTEKDKETLERHNFFMAIMGPEKAKAFFSKVEAHSSQALAATSDALAAQFPRWSMIKIEAAPLRFSEDLPVMAAILPPSVEIHCDHLHGTYDYARSIHKCLSLCAQNLKALTLNLDWSSDLRRRLEKFVDNHSRHAGNEGLIHRLGSVADVDSLPVGSALDSSYRTSSRHDEPPLPPGLDMLMPMPDLSLPNLKVLKLNGFNPYRGDHQQLLSKITFPGIAKVNALSLDPLPSDRDFLLSPSTVPPTPSDVSAPVEITNDLDTSNSAQIVLVTAVADPTSPSATPLAPPTPSSPDAPSRTSQRITPARSRRLGQPTTCTKRHLHFEFPELRSRVEVPESRASLQLILNLHRDALGEALESGCLERLETYDLLVRLIRHINPLSLTIIPGPAPSIASDFLRMFRGPRFSLARASCCERNQDPIYRQVTGNFVSFTIGLLQDARPACITSAPWSYTADDAKGLQAIHSPIASVKSTDDPYVGYEAESALLERQAIELFHFEAYHRKTTIFGQLRAMMLARSATLNTFQKVTLDCMDQLQWLNHTHDAAKYNALSKKKEETVEHLLQREDIPEETKSQLRRWRPKTQNKTPRPLLISHILVRPTTENLIGSQHLLRAIRRKARPLLLQALIVEVFNLQEVADAVSGYRDELKLFESQFILGQEWALSDEAERRILQTSLTDTLTRLLRLRSLSEHEVLIDLQILLQRTEPNTAIRKRSTKQQTAHSSTSLSRHELTRSITPKVGRSILKTDTLASQVSDVRPTIELCPPQKAALDSLGAVDDVNAMHNERLAKFVDDAAEQSAAGLVSLGVCHRLYLGQVEPVPSPYAPAFRSESPLDEVAPKTDEGAQTPAELPVLSRSISLRTNGKGKVKLAASVTSSDSEESQVDEPSQKADSSSIRAESKERSYSLKAKKSMVLGLVSFEGLDL